MRGGRDSVIAWRGIDFERNLDGLRLPVEIGVGCRYTQYCVLGYYQPELSKLADEPCLEWS